MDELKKQAALLAVDKFVRSGMVVGLGTGSTAFFATESIGQKLAAGELKDIIGIATSARTQEHAHEVGIPVRTLDEHPVVDVTYDGADEVDPHTLDIVKGRMGGLLRKKLVGVASKLYVCIADESKLVTGLGGSGLSLPVEVVQFCHVHIARQLAALPEIAGCEAKLRLQGDTPFLTPNGNCIIDLFFPAPIADVHAAARAIHNVVGVVEHGLFLNMVDVCIVARPGGVEVHERKR